MDIFVGNFPFDTTEEQLTEAFAEFGTVERVKLIYDRETQRPRGFGFVTMSDWKDAQNAIRDLDGKDFGGRPLRVNQAQQREERGGGGGGGGGGGYGGGGGGRGRDDRGGGRGRDDRGRDKRDW